jgi:hypothetical protein
VWPDSTRAQPPRRHGWADDAFGVVIQDDGKIVASGDVDFCFDGCNPKIGVARYNPDGTLDTTFSGNGKVKTNFTPRIDGASDMASNPMASWWS